MLREILSTAKKAAQEVTSMSAAAAGGYMEGFVNGAAGLQNLGLDHHARRADILHIKAKRSRSLLERRFWEGRAAFHVAACHQWAEEEA